MILEPRSEVDVRDAVLDARARKAPLAIMGGGTKQGLGRPVQAAATLSMKYLTGITLYEPAEMVIGAWAGTPLAEVQKALDEKGQMLAFEPPDLRKLLGTTGEPTIGGMTAAGLAGPRRVTAGGLRDSLIGVRFVNGRGEIVKNGGRVMKNVTGLDLVKPQAGAHGTLGVLTEVIFKVVPKAPAVAHIQFEGLDISTAIRMMAKALGSPFEITGASHLPGSILPGDALTWLRIEGFPEQLTYRIGELRKLLSDFGPFGSRMSNETGFDKPANIEFIDGGGGEPLANFGHPCVWRVSVPPSKGAAFTDSVKAETGGAAYFDWGGGLVWLATREDERIVQLIQSAATSANGHATLIRAPEALRAAAPVFQPQPEAVMRIQRGLKASFDPDGILNPGRMYAGI
jgi:glycolate oxidase FAD binding subunit